MESSGCPASEARRQEPCASLSPKPSRAAVFFTISTMEAAFPKERSMPVSASVTRPFSKSSMAQAIVLPIVMVSIPSSLQRKLALVTAERSLIPQAAPNDQADSYSGPSPEPA